MNVLVGIGIGLAAAWVWHRVVLRLVRRVVARDVPKGIRRQLLGRLTFDELQDFQLALTDELRRRETSTRAAA